MSSPNNQHSGPDPATSLKPRSCVTCRRRKVRCDKRSPCANCRLADITCVFPPTDRPPRWARRIREATAAAVPDAGRPPRNARDEIPSAVSTSLTGAAGAADVSQVIERLRHLENLVTQLSGQAEPEKAQDQSSVGSGRQDVANSHVAGGSPLPPLRGGTGVSPVGRLVVDDESRGRYVSSGFWSRVNDELDDLKVETERLRQDELEISRSGDSSQVPTAELVRSPSDRHAFLFGHNLSAARPSTLNEFRPLPSQIPFLFQVYVDNVNVLIQIVHVPTVTKLIRDVRTGGSASLKPGDEALLFSIYFAAITSMEEDDVTINFGTSKTDLALKFRYGFEHAMAKADFLNEADLALLQALIIFLFLLRRNDSPRFVWMMTGLAVRMALSLGLHRDGTKLKHLTPLEIEVRRRVWWALCVLDVRTSEELGMDLTIAYGSSDTELPLRINDTDIDAGTKEMPVAREGVTDMTFALVTFELCDLTRRLMAIGPNDVAAASEKPGGILDEMYERCDDLVLRYGKENHQETVYWVGVTVAELFVAKMTLIVSLPSLLSRSNGDDTASRGLRDKLFAAAIKVAESHHALNAEPRCRHWRWAFQSYVQWHAIAFILMDIGRRVWTPTVERAWAALHSPHLIPSRAGVSSKSVGVWLPLRKLMVKSRRHREAEVARLRGDPQAALRLDQEEADEQEGFSPTPLLQLPGFQTGNVLAAFRERWRSLVGLSSPGASVSVPAAATPSPAASAGRGGGTGADFTFSPSRSVNAHALHADRVSEASFYPASGQRLVADAGITGSFPGSNDLLAAHLGTGTAFTGIVPPGSGSVSTATTPLGGLSGAHHNLRGQHRDVGVGGADHTTQLAAQLQPELQGFPPWLWADADPTVNVFGDSGTFGDGVSGGGGVIDMDLDLDLDAEVDWQGWLGEVRGLQAVGG